MAVNTIMRWGRTAGGLALGGMVFALALLLGLWILTGVVSGGTLLTSQATGFWSLAAAWVGVSFIAARVLRLFRWGCGTVFTAIFFWTTGYVIVWLLGDYLGGLSLPIFLGFWVAVAALMALVWQPTAGGARRPVTRAPAVNSSITGATRRLPPLPAGQAVMRRSDYGRIPAETLALMTSQVRGVREEVLAALPPGAPANIRAMTTRAVLDRTLRDWWENGNTEGLPSQDLTDLSSFVALAASLAGDWYAPDAQAIYSAMLDALLDDWLVAWNANGVDGPPRRG